MFTYISHLLLIIVADISWDRVEGFDFACSSVNKCCL